MDVDLYNQPVPLPRGGLRFPVELLEPPGFRVEEPSTWPRVSGRLEYVRGRLLYMPPCGDVQGPVAASVMGILEPWSEARPEFIVEGNEAGMLLGGEVRGADGAVWRRADVGERTGGFMTVAPVLAVEVAGQDEGEAVLREKARWYLERGVAAVWLVLPDSREIVVLRANDERRYGPGQRLAPEPELPDLTPPVDRFFRQLR